MELIIEQIKPSVGMFIAPIALILFVAMIPIALFVLADNEEENDGLKLELLKIFSMLFAIVVILLILIKSVIPMALYSLDYALENINTSEIVLVKEKTDNTGSVFYDENYHRFTTSNLSKEVHDDLMINYMNRKCEIEYYKLSRRIIRVRRVE